MTNRHEGNRKYRERSFGRQVAFQLVYQEEMNPGTIDRFSNDFIYDELSRFSTPLTPSSEESAAELDAIREQIVNDPPQCTQTISGDEFRNLVEFVQSLVHGVLKHREELDQIIAQTSKNWSLSRMVATDRNIIRLAVYEMQFMKTPRPVVIHEALELGKVFGTAQSVGFINGVLDAIGRKDGLPSTSNNGNG